MKTEINFTVDLSNPVEVQAAIAMLEKFDTLGKPRVSETKEVKKAVQAVAKAPEKHEGVSGTNGPSAPVGILEKAEVQTAAPEPTPEPENEQPFVGEKEPSIKIEDIRELLAKKVGNHRATIKTELSRLGAANISTVKPEDYQAFMDFLNKLA